jgi:hypothetical protein
MNTTKKNKKMNIKKNTRKNIRKNAACKIYIMKGGARGWWSGWLDGPYYTFWTKGIGPYFNFLGSYVSKGGKSIFSWSPQVFIATTISGIVSSVIDVVNLNKLKIQEIIKAVVEPLNNKLKDVNQVKQGGTRSHK